MAKLFTVNTYIFMGQAGKGIKQQGRAAKAKCRRGINAYTGKGDLHGYRISTEQHTEKGCKENRFKGKCPVCIT